MMRPLSPMIRMIVCAAVLAACAVRGFCLDEAESGAVARIEKAYRLALSGSRSDDEKVEAARVRCQSLGMLVDVSYQSTLTWLAENGDLSEAVSADQKLWQNAYRIWSDRAEQKDAKARMAVRAFGRASEMALARLAVFRTVTSGPAFSCKAW